MMISPGWQLVLDLLLARLVAADTVAEDWAASRQTDGGSIRADSAWVRGKHGAAID